MQISDKDCRKVYEIYNDIYRHLCNLKFVFIVLKRDMSRPQWAIIRWYYQTCFIVVLLFW
jgi:hypothetical protein